MMSDEKWSGPVTIEYEPDEKDQRITTNNILISPPNKMSVSYHEGLIERLSDENYFHEYMKAISIEKDQRISELEDKNIEMYNALQSITEDSCDLDHVEEAERAIHYVDKAYTGKNNKEINYLREWKSYYEKKFAEGIFLTNKEYSDKVDEITQLKTKLLEAEKDSKRLEWMMKNEGMISSSNVGHFIHTKNKLKAWPPEMSPHQAIDLAMKESKK